MMGVTAYERGWSPVPSATSMAIVSFFLQSSIVIVSVSPHLSLAFTYELVFLAMPAR
jgi:hypothetical protein